MDGLFTRRFGFDGALIFHQGGMDEGPSSPPPSSPFPPPPPPVEM